MNNVEIWNWYFITNILSWFVIATIFIIVFLCSKQKWKELTTKKIVLIAKFSAIAVSLSLASHQIIIPGLESIRFSWGDWIIFLEGLLFGPLIGIVGAVCYDVLQNIVGVGGSYHSGFQLDFVLYALVGGLVKVCCSKTIFKYQIAFVAYALTYTLISLLLNPIWLWTIGWSKAIFVNIVLRITKLGPCIGLYGCLLMISYKILSRPNFALN